MNKIAKINVYILAVTLLLGVGQVFAAWDGDYSKAVRPSSSKDGYFLINNENELAYFSRQAGNNCNAGNIRLMADMDLGGHHFTPLCAGNGDSKFDKIFDGNGFTIKNLYIDSDTLSAKNTNYAQNLGLIAALKGTIKNVNFENAKIYASQDEGKIIQKGEGVNPISVGVAVGWMPGGTVSGVNVISCEIRTSGTGQSVGGVVGYVEKNTGPATISNCYSNAEIIAYGNRVYAGGVAGYAKGDDITISGVVFDGTVNNEGNGKSGGILGKIADGSTKVSVENCYYDSTMYKSGIGDVSSAGTGKITGDTTGVNVVNSEKVACALNGGELDENGVCDKQEPWALGQSGNVSLNGSDGYKITFVSNGGEFPDGAKTFKFVSKGGSITSDEIATPTREGKKFAGWALDADTTEPAIDLGTAAAATKVYAVWHDFYTVTFNAESWNEAKTTRVAKHGTISVDGFDVPGSYTNGASNKYFFTGWAYETRFLEKAPTPDDTLHLAAIDVVSDTALHAVWTLAKTYSVTFNAMEHGNTDVHFVKIVSQGDTVSEPENFVGEEGYKLEGWYSDAERENRYNFGDTITKNIILYAKWDTLSYNITYENCGEGCVNGNPATYTKASSTVTFAKASRNGYTFGGWFYDSDFKNPATQIISGSIGNRTVYAKWTEITYTVRYAAGTNGLGNYPDAVKHVGKNLTLLGAVMRRAGYTQVGWATSDGGEKVYELEATYSEDADLTLYPVWEIVTYTITYVCEGCDVSNETKFPRTFTIVTNNFSIPNPTSLPEGYSFGGWFKNAQFSGKQNNNFTKGTYGDFTFYGKLNKIYKITYVGTENPNNVTTYTVDDEKTFKAPKDSAGYTFGGWFANAEFEGDAVTGIVKGTIGDKTFYAKWIAEEYTITYHNVEGATFETSNPETYTVEDEFPIVLNEPTKVGFNFLGWSLTENSTEYVDDIAAGSTGDKTFYANWEKVYPFLVNDFGAVKVYEDEEGKLTAKINTNSSEAVVIPSDVVVNRVEFVRKFTVGKNSTIMLPFSIDTTKISGGSFKEFAYVDESVPKAVFYNDVAGGVIQANTPYIFVPTSDTLIFNLEEGETVSLNTNDIVVPVSNKDGGKWQFKGVYSRIDWPSGDRQAWGFVANSDPDPEKVGKFKRAGAGAYINPLRGYLYNTQAEEQTSVQQSARRFLAKAAYASAQTASIGSDDANSMEVDFIEREVETEPEVEETTVISKVIPISGGIKAVNGWFDMKGRRLNAKPTTKGIYYFNGKQVIVQ